MMTIIIGTTRFKFGGSAKYPNILTTRDNHIDDITSGKRATYIQKTCKRDQHPNMAAKPAILISS